MIPCTATRADGTPCKGRALPGRSLCWAHSPDHQAKAVEARRKGGSNRSNASRAKKHMSREVRDIVQIVEAAMGGVLQSKITPPQAQAVASLAGAWVKLHELGEMESRLRDLEERAAAQPTGANRRAW